MSFEAGHKKAGGRKKGTPNKKSEYLFDHFEELKFKPVERLIEIFPNLTADKQAHVLLQLLTFMYPKRKAIESTDASNGEVTLVFDCADKNL